MADHERKICPVCHNSFECKASSITICQCSLIELTPEIREHLGEKFHDCLCKECLEKLIQDIPKINH